MEIVLDQKETEDILLAWARQAVPGIAVNTASLDCGYGTLRRTTLSWEEPEQRELPL